MLKVTLMQRWCGLSDPAMEEAIADRLSLRRFLGLGIDDPGIDHATIAFPTSGCLTRAWPTSCSRSSTRTCVIRG